MRKLKIYFPAVLIAWWLLIFFFAVAQVFVGVITGQWNKFFFPFLLFLWLAIQLERYLERLSKKKIFIVVKDKDW